MKRRLISVLLAATVVAGTLAGCGGGSDAGSADQGTEPPAASNGGSEDAGSDAATAGGEEGKVINIYSFNDELRTRITAVYPAIEHTSDDGTVSTLNDGTEIHWIINPNQDGVYQDKLDEALLNQADAAADDKVDLFAAELDYIVKYTDADIDVAMPLTDLGINPDSDLSDQFAFTKTVASDANGVQRASTWQACPGVLVYRRDIAKDVFGTDDPIEIGKKTADWATMKTTAEELKAKGYYAFSSYADTFRTYGNNIAGPWGEAGSTTIKVDQKVLDWVNDSKEWMDAGYFDPTVTGQWTSDWFTAMSSSAKVFAFLFPAWGIDTQMVPNWDGEEGAWAATNAPLPYNWGGTYLVAATGTDNPGHVKDIIMALTGSQDNLTKVAKEYTEFTNAQSVMDAAASNDEFNSAFLGSQNPYGYFADSLSSIKMAPLSAYDQGCVELIQNAFGDYLQGQIDYDTAKANFETAIMERYPEITEIQWP